MQPGQAPQTGLRKNISQSYTNSATPPRNQQPPQAKKIKKNSPHTCKSTTAYITLMTDDSSIAPTNTFSRNAYAYFYKRLT